MTALPAAVTCIPVPTPFAVGRINCYLIEDDPLTLVDTGPNSGTALVYLRDAIRAAGHDIEDLERIVLTHQHLDHTGLAGILVERSGAEVVALDVLAPWLANYDAEVEADDDWASRLLASHGVSDEMVIALRSIRGAFHGWGAAVETTRTVAEGDVLEFASRSWTVHYRPGHSPSDTVFHDAGARILIGGDHLLKTISSNALVSRSLTGGEGRSHSLVDYRASLSATREMDLDVVLGGHGEVVTEHRELIDSRFAGYERRARKIAGLIAERPLTAHEIALELWGNVALTQAYLTISEVLGHLDLLGERGEAVEELGEDGVIRFSPS